MRERRLNNAENGFTLVELVLVALLLAIMSGILYGTIDGIVSTKNRIESHRKMNRVGAAVISRLSRELAGTMSGIQLSQNLNDDDSNDTQDDNNPASSNPFVPPLLNKDFFKGKASRGRGEQNEIIYFVSNSASQVFLSGGTNYGPVEVSYSLKRNPEPDVDKYGSDAPLVLVRSEQPADPGNEKTAEERRVVLPIADNVISLGFRYLLRGEWKDSFESVAQAIPSVVEITLRLRGENGETLAYRTAVSVSTPN